MSQHGTPQIYFYQMNVIHAHLSELLDLLHQNNDACHVNHIYAPLPKLYQRTLLKQKDWEEWNKSEWKQLNQYFRQGMFGQPSPITSDLNSFNLVWTYIINTYGSMIKKARCTCDGSPCSGMEHKLEHTYYACANQNAARLFYEITAMKNNMLCGCDITNAFGEAAGPDVIILYHVLQHHHTLLSQSLVTCKGIQRHLDCGLIKYIIFFNVLVLPLPHMDHVYILDILTTKDYNYFVRSMILRLGPPI